MNILNRSVLSSCALLLAACSSTSAQTASSTASASAGTSVVAGVLIVGTLAGDDLATSQAQHDGLAKGGQAQAASAGDIGHTVMLGTTILGTTQNEFLALDRWSNAAPIDGFYANPQFAAGLDALFTAAPTPVVYVPQPAWAGYGTPDVANASDPHYWVIVRGTLKSEDAATNQATHDGIFTNVIAKAQAAGDHGHIVWTGRDDDTQFLAIDVWSDPTNIPAFYGDSNLQAAFGTLFNGPPSVSVYASTHWYQW